MTETLFESMNPAIVGLRRWFNGYSIQIDPDGNCFGTSWLVSTLLWAVQKSELLDVFIVRLKEADGQDGAFSTLDTTCKVMWRPLLSSAADLLCSTLVESPALLAVPCVR